MPELPDVTVYLEALQARIQGTRLEGVRSNSPFLVRSVAPPPGDCVGRRVIDLRRIGKRIAIGFEGDLWLVLHLMIAGRLHWYDRATGKRRQALLELEFERGILTLTEAGSKRRASLHVVAGATNLRDFDRGGLEVLSSDVEAFATRLRSENHTLKRALTDPRLLSGIGNAYSDEILHAAQLSPLALTRSLSDAEIQRLHDATVGTLNLWLQRLRTQSATSFPEKVTAFHAQMAVHGKFGQPCPVCGTRVQRIRYAENETNYCPRCQTGGRVLADRSLSRLLKADWPRTIEELERGR